MRSDIFWIDHPQGHRLGIMARPRAGDWLEDEIEGWHRDGVGLVVSLLEPEEIAELGLGEERALCAEAGIDFLSFPMPDRGVPADREAAESLATRVGRAGMAGKAVAIHCRAGIGRSALIAGMALVEAGLSAEDALDAIGKARGVEVPDTEAQGLWLAAFARRTNRQEPPA
jgi:protein-tyrosine phosphatase